MYKPSCVVVLRIEEEYPVFGKVEDIYVSDSNVVYFHVQLLSTIQYSSHYHMRTLLIGLEPFQLYIFIT